MLILTWFVLSAALAAPVEGCDTALARPVYARFRVNERRPAAAALYAALPALAGGSLEVLGEAALTGVRVGPVLVHGPDAFFAKPHDLGNSAGTVHVVTLALSGEVFVYLLVPAVHGPLPAGHSAWITDYRSGQRWVELVSY